MKWLHTQWWEPSLHHKHRNKLPTAHPGVFVAAAWGWVVMKRMYVASSYQVSVKVRQPVLISAVLDREVLRVAMLHRNDLIAEENLGPNATQAEIHHAYRHAAYRQFILSQYGRSGQGVRRVISSCCVWKICNTFPNPNIQLRYVCAFVVEPFIQLGLYFFEKV